MIDLENRTSTDAGEKYLLTVPVVTLPDPMQSSDDNRENTSSGEEEGSGEEELSPHEEQHNELPLPEEIISMIGLHIHFY